MSWLERLPSTIANLSRRWNVEVGAPFHPLGATAWVAPAIGDRGQNLVIKLLRPHQEAAHEADALRLWAGRGAVLLHAAEDLGHTQALLLERCHPGTALSTRPEEEQDEVLTGLLRRLWIAPPPDHPFRSLEEMCIQWADEASARVNVDAGLARAGMELFRQLPSTADRDVVLCTDLHAGNVLAAQREPWLAIDPKAHVGDPTYDVLQHMLNCPARLRSDPLQLVERVAHLAGLDPERTKLWLFARCVQESADQPELAGVARSIG